MGQDAEQNRSAGGVPSSAGGLDSGSEAEADASEGAAAAGSGHANAPVTEESLLPLGEGGRDALGPSWLPALLMFLSVAVLMGTLIRRNKIVRARSMASGGARVGVRAGDVPRERPAWSGGGSGVGSGSGDMTTLMADFEELAERLAAQLDNKAERLEQLLAEADRMMREINGRLSARIGEDEAEREPGVGAGVLARGGAGRGSAGRHEHARGGRATASEEETPASHRRVHALADSGLSAADIARETGQPVGQVELILNLRH